MHSWWWKPETSRGVYLSSAFPVSSWKFELHNPPSNTNTRLSAILWLISVSISSCSSLHSVGNLLYTQGTVWCWWLWPGTSRQCQFTIPTWIVAPYRKQKNMQFILYMPLTSSSSPFSHNFHIWKNLLTSSYKDIPIRKKAIKLMNWFSTESLHCQKILLHLLKRSPNTWLQSSVGGSSAWAKSQLCPDLTSEKHGIWIFTGDAL